MQSRTYGSYRNVHHFGDLFIAQLLDFSQNKCCPQVGRQLVENSLYDHAILNCAALMILDAIKLCRFRPLETKPIHAEPHADSIKKPRERPVVSQTVQLAKSLQKCLLRDVFSFMAISQEVGCGSNKAISMPLNEQTEGAIVPFSTTRYPSEFVTYVKSHCGVHVRIKHRSNVPTPSNIARVGANSKSFALQFNAGPPLGRLPT